MAEIAADSADFDHLRADCCLRDLRFPWAMSAVVQRAARTMRGCVWMASYLASNKKPVTLVESMTGQVDQSAGDQCFSSHSVVRGLKSLRHSQWKA